MTTDPGRPDIASLSFEQALEELEGIVKTLESGRSSLEESINAYQRGALLKSHCEKKLKEAQAKVETIALGPNGDITASPSDLE